MHSVKMSEHKSSDSKYPLKQDETRDHLVVTAVKFLQNPRVRNTPLYQKQKFLKSKGLNDEEIRIALEQSASIMVNDVSNQRVIEIPQYQYQLPPPTIWSKLRDIANTAAIISGLIYGLYLLYKKYIHDLIFGKRKKPKTVEESIENLEKTVGIAMETMEIEVKKINTELSKLSDQAETSENAGRQIQDLKTEFSSVKNILLSRNQFPAPMSSSLILPPSIPSWQMTSKGTKVDVEAEEICTSGSGFSESETFVNNDGSDSSLEMLRGE